MGSAAAEARDRLRNTSTLCLRKLHEQCVAEICECECHGRVPPSRVAPSRPDPGITDERKKRRTTLSSPPATSMIAELDRRAVEQASTPAEETAALSAPEPPERPVAADVAPEEPTETEPPTPEGWVYEGEVPTEGAGGAWEDPPSRKRPIIPPAERALVDAWPGRWRRVRTYGGGATANQARVRLRKQDEVDFDVYEVKAARLDEGGSALFVRRRA